MTEYNFPWAGTSLGKAGPYSASLFRQFTEDLLAINGIANAGIIIGRGNGVDAPLDVQQTSPASKNVRVRAGSAFVNGLWYYTDDDVLVAIDDNTDGSGFDRIDLLVLRSNSTTQIAVPTVIKGTPAASPVAPSPVRSGAIYDIELAQVTAQNLFTTILNADIDTSVQTTAPVWPVENGGTGIDAVALGDVLIANAANTLSVFNLDDYYSLVRDTGAGNSFGQGTLAQSVAYYETAYGTNGATFTGSTWNIVPYNNLQDDAGIFTSLVAGVFTIANTGIYMMTVLEQATRVPAIGAADAQPRLRNTTTATTIGQGLAANLAASTAYDRGAISWMRPLIFSASAGDTLEIQFWCDKAATLGLAATKTIDSVQQAEKHGFVSFRRVQ